MASETLESHLESHGIGKVCLAMTSGAPESHLEGYAIVRVCLSMASATVESHLEGHAMVFQKYACPWLVRHRNLTLRVMML